MAVPPLLELLLLLLVGLAAASDLATRRIPNRLLLAGALGALAGHLCSAFPLQSCLTGLAGAGTGLLLFLPLYLLRGMAAGDVKLMATVGAFGAPLEAVQIALVAMLAGGALSLAVVLVRGRLPALVANLRSLLLPALLRVPGAPMAGASVGAIPYGVAIAAGAVYVIAQRYSHALPSLL
jgi:prepilin peptidase CpaA